jgi:hypothetical protein
VATGSDDTPGPGERRPTRRKKVLFAGIVTYGGGGYVYDCAIRDLSQQGAQLVVGKNVQLPTDLFVISIRDRTAYDAKAVWKEGSRIGVIFKKTYPLTDIVDPSLGYLKQLWLSRAPRSGC